MTVKVVTHDRIHHADEVLGTAIIKMAFGSVSVIRTRDTGLVRQLAGQPDTYLLDIGGQYCPEKGIFDHHQTEGAGFREGTDWPYATAGLVWRHFGAKAIKSIAPQLADSDVQEALRYVDEALIKYVDAQDCGFRRAYGPTFSSLVASFNPSWTEGVVETNEFDLVVDLSQVLLSNNIKRFVGRILARERVRQAQSLKDGRVLILDHCHPWSSVVAHEFPDVLFVAYPIDGSEDGRWQARTACDQNERPRACFPRSWAGLENEAFESVAGPGAIFCHRGLHLAGAASKEALFSMLDLALYEHERICGEQLALPLAA